MPYQFLLAGWVVLSAPAWLSKIGDNTFIAIYDYARRGILIMPLTFIIAGLFLTQVGFWLQERVKPTRNNGRLILTLLIGAILITAFTDYQAYFGRWQADPYLTQVFSPRFIPVVQKLKELAQPEALFIFPINASKDTTERPDLYTLGFLYQGKAALALTNNYEASLPQKLTALIQNRKIVYLLQFTDQDDPKQAIAWWLAAYGKPQPVVPEVPGYKVSAFELNSTTEDLTNLPQPITLTIPFGRQAQLVGYRYGSNVSRQGFTLQKVESAGHLLVNLSWQVMGEDAPDYNTAIILRDAANQVIAQTDAPLLNLAGLTSNQWLADETEQIYLTMPLPIGLAPGQYWLDVVLYEGATLRRETPVTTQGDLSYRLGLVTVLPAANPAELTPQLASVVSNPIEISPALRLAGTSLPPAQTLSPGDLLQGVLYWQALTPLADDVIADYVLIRANDRLTVSLAQTIPLGGLDYPTHRWRATEIVADYLTLQIPPDVPSGTFWLGIRLTHGIGQTLAEIPLSQVTITAWERLFNLPTGVSPLVRQFDNSIKLVGADLPETVSVNQTLPIRLFWQTDQFIQNNYKTFIHIFGENDQIIGQDDSIPGQGKRSTRGWLPGEVVEDYHEISLSADVTPGVYRVVIGLYDTVSGSRLAAQTHLEASEENSVLIGQVKIQ